MIVDDNQNSAYLSSDNDELDDNLLPSKSQLKRDAHAVRDLGTELAELSTAERARIPLPQDITDAIEELNRTTKHGARKRQLGWLAKRLRLLDVEPIEAALESIKQAARTNSQAFHQIEQWRDRLLGEHETESPKDALTAFLDRYPHADRQQLRQLQRAALNEKQAEKPPRSVRLLFKTLRDAITQLPNDSN